MIHILFIIFLFLLGSCVGSFLNVVVWRLPRNESIVSPRSRCPKCGTALAWYDNIPVFGWIMLRGKCRYCGQPISIRYPIFEAITGGLFVLYYAAFFIYQEGPCQIVNGEFVHIRDMTLQQDWPLYGLYMLLIAGLLASSLIDAEHYIIPIEIPWLIACIAFVVHAFIDMRYTPGALNATPPVGAMAAGAGVGVLVSMLLLRSKILPQSFADGGPLLEIDKKNLADQGQAPPPEYTAAQVRGEMQKEMIYLMPPMLLGAICLLLTWKVPVFARMWDSLMAHDWFSGFLGSLWGALVGAFIIWFIRIFGSIIFGREAMGLGDVHLMVGIGAVIGAAATFVFFIAPFIGLLFGLYKLIFRRGRELPYGPFLSLATAVVLIFYCRLVMHFGPASEGIMQLVRIKLLGE